MKAEEVPLKTLRSNREPGTPYFGAIPQEEYCQITHCEMAFSSKGVIQITLNTGLGSYRYIFPAKVR